MTVIRSHVTVRRATAADAAMLAELGERLFRDTFSADNRPEDLEAYVVIAYDQGRLARELADPAHRYLVAEVDGRVAGYALVRDGDAPASVGDAGALELARFYVDRSWHGAGVAKVLMDACVAEVRAAGAPAIWLGVWERNARAIRFYEKCGFRDVGAHVFMLGTDVQSDRVMLLPLPQG